MAIHWKQLVKSKSLKSEEDQLVFEALSSSEGFSMLYKRWVSPVYKYIFSRIGSQQDAEDLTADVFYCVMNSLNSYRFNDYFAAWLFTIARNQVNMYFRKQRKNLDLHEFDIVDNNSNLIEAVQMSNELEQLKMSFQKLSDKEQELLRLRYVVGIKFREIAILLNRNEAAIKKAIYRLQARLRKSLEEDHE